MRGRRWRWLAVAGLGALAACSQGPLGQAPAAGGLAGSRVEAAAVWSGAEADNFRSVLRAFSQGTGVSATFTTLRQRGVDEVTEMLDEGRQADVTFVSEPGYLRQLVREGRVHPVDADTEAEVGAYYDPVWRQPATVGGRLYGVFFKAANKSVMWYAPDTLRQAGLRQPPASWDELLGDGRALAAAGLPAVSMGSGGQDAWTLTDWFENVYLSQAGPAMYDRLARHEVSWEDPSVRQALRTLAALWGDRALLDGGAAGALDTTYLQSVDRFVRDRPRPALLYEADFVETQLLADGARPGVDYGVFPFPAAGTTRDAVIVGGDMAVLTRDTPAGRALMRYLASPEAAVAWIDAPGGGGFISPNSQVAPSLYRGGRMEAVAAAGLAGASLLRFDLSDEAPASFGAQTEWQDLHDFLAAPEDDAGAAARLERDAASAYRDAGRLPPPPSPGG